MNTTTYVTLSLLLLAPGIAQAADAASGTVTRPATPPRVTAAQAAATVTATPAGSSTAGVAAAATKSRYSDAAIAAIFAAAEQDAQNAGVPLADYATSVFSRRFHYRSYGSGSTTAPTSTPAKVATPSDSTSTGTTAASAQPQ